MQPAIETDRYNPVHVLEVIGNASKGGMENYLKNFISSLPPRQFRITCICPYESAFTAALRRLNVEGLYITPIADDPPWHSVQLVMEVARMHQVDVLHAHMPKAHVLAGVAGCLLHKPVVATVHGMQVTAHELGITRAVGSHLITNCQEAYIQALALGVSPSRVSLVRNGVDTALFTPAPACPALRQSLHLPPASALVGFVGRLDYEKGPDLFLHTAEYVHQLRPDVHFVLVGDGAMRCTLQKTVRKMHLHHRVHFVGWHTDTPAIYASLDLLVHTSRSDGTSLVLLEAMASGCPVVALSVGGVPEIVENESTGMLAEAADWQGAGQQILQLLQQPERLQRMGAAARARAEKNFSLEANTRSVSALLRRLAGPDADPALIPASNGSNAVNGFPLHKTAGQP